MESNRISQTTHAAQPHSKATSVQKTASDPQPLNFMQTLAQAMDTTEHKITQSEPATLATLVKPRSHLQLISLNPVETTYTPAPSALERIGGSRILPFSTVSAS